MREILERFGMTQTELAKRFGIPLRTVQSWCSSSDSKRDCPEYVKRMIVEILSR